jgi:hypothetical protein
MQTMLKSCCAACIVGKLANNALMCDGMLGDDVIDRGDRPGASKVTGHKDD